MSGKFWDMEVSEDGSFRMCEPTGTYAIDFGDQGNLHLVGTKHLGRFLKDYALWRLMESEKLLEEILGDVFISSPVYERATLLLGWDVE